MPRRTMAGAIAAVAVLASIPSIPAIASSGSFTPAAAAPTLALQPRIYGGTPAPGYPGVVALALREGGAWTGECSAALWKPRVLITAAHCVTATRSAGLVDDIAVFPPGAAAVISVATGPQGASSARITGIFRAPDYVEANATVDPNDFAVLVLDRDLGPAGYARLATGTELRRWAAARALIDHVGYGLTGVGTSVPDPVRVQLPLTEFSASTRLGPAFATEQSPSAGVCPGDSGSPASRTEPTVAALPILLGPMVGGNAPCSGATSYSNVGIAAMGYLPVVNAALASVGVPTIPNGPAAVTVVARNRDAIVSWPAPVISPETVVGYDVTDVTGAVVCATAALTCTVSGLPDGEHRFWVRARNVQGEGGSSIEPAVARIAAPARLPAPVVARRDGRTVLEFASLAGQSSAVVLRYVVRTTTGQVLCRGLPPDPAMTTLRCERMPRQPGTYRATVTAVTEMGRTPASAPSRPFRVR